MASDLHIAGIIRLHRFEEEIERVLGSLAGFCDGLYVLTDNVSPQNLGCTHVGSGHVQGREGASIDQTVDAGRFS